MPNNDEMLGTTGEPVKNSAVNLKTVPQAALTTLGCKVSWAWEKTAGVRPGSTQDKETKYAIIYDCTKSLPLGASPDKLETTPLIAKYNKTYVSGLQDLGDSTIECNWTPAIINTHAGWLMYAPSARTSGKRLWLCIDIVGSPTSYYVPTYPSNMMIDALEPNGAPKYVINFDLQGDFVTDSDPSYINDEGATQAYWLYNTTTGLNGFNTDREATLS